VGVPVTAMPAYVVGGIALSTIRMHAEHFDWELRQVGDLEIQLARKKARIRVTFTRRGQVNRAEKSGPRKTRTVAMNNKLNTVLDWMEEKS